jgi:hypothetical protein
MNSFRPVSWKDNLKGLKGIGRLLGRRISAGVRG